MFVVRRVFKVALGQSVRGVAAEVFKLGKLYEEAGQRSPSRVYTSGTTTPGPANTVYMEWIEEALLSPYRSDNPQIPGQDRIYASFGPAIEDTWIEFYELYVPDDGQ